MPHNKPLARQKGLERIFILRNKEPGDDSCLQGLCPSPLLGTTHAVQGPASGGGARLECDSLALRDALLAECDSPDPLSPPKASASTPQHHTDHQIKELRATAEAAKPWREECGGVGKASGQLSPGPAACPRHLSTTVRLLP